MNVQLIGGPRDQDWIVVRDGMRTFTTFQLMDIPQVKAMGPEGATLPLLDVPVHEHVYKLMAHDNNTFTFEYQG